jgi:hypothetical protein
MNERIKELSKQATKTTTRTGAFGLQQSESKVDLEKFAELIVQECIAVASKQRNPTNLNYKPSEQFVDELKLHFGVK